MFFFSGMFFFSFPRCVNHALVKCMIYVLITRSVKKMLLYVIILFRYGFHALRRASGMVFMLFANLSGMVFMLLRLAVFIPKYN